MANTENIEAKLAAYVEGELDASERAEIEKHLAGNPQHQALLAELQKMRNVVRELPKESAPPEIFERVQQQIERSLLLGESSESTAPVRMKRGPSLLMAASILFLATGLAVVIYFSLPNRSEPNILASRAKPAQPIPSTSEMIASKAADPVADAVKDSAKTGADQPSAGVSAPPAIMPPVAAAPPTEPRMGKMAAKESEPFGMVGGAKRADAPPANDAFSNNERMYLVVDSANPTETANGLNNYLADNKLNWQVDAEPMPEPIEPSKESDVLASRMRQQSVQVKTVPSNSVAQQQLSLDSSHTQQRILVKNVTAAQVSELNTVLAKSGARQQAQFITNRAENTSRQVTGWPEHLQNAATTREMEQQANQSATTQPAVQTGQLLRITVDQLVGPGVDKTNTVKVNDDGTIALPMVEPIRVAGLDETQVKSKIADTYRDAQLIAAPTVTLTKVEGPTTQPAQEGQVAAATTQPTEQHALGEQGAIQQVSAPTTAPADTVDIVIVVQSAASPEIAAPAPATQPTTQPAAAEQP